MDCVIKKFSPSFRQNFILSRTDMAIIDCSRGPSVVVLNRCGDITLRGVVGGILLIKYCCVVNVDATVHGRIVVRKSVGVRLSGLTHHLVADHSIIFGENLDVEMSMSLQNSKVTVEMVNGPAFHGFKVLT